MKSEPIGLLNLNKPAGWSSRQAVDAVARVAGTGRVGHAGTLDPLATGVLVVCLGWGTRLVSCVQELPKRYHAGFLMGRTSDTDDVTGDVVDFPHAAVPSRAAILELLPRFTGRIAQVPPSHSAVHVQGRRAYALARQGQRVELAPRDVDVYRLELIAYEHPRLELDIECGSGTYVRSLGRDLGQALGCGAVMSQLERTAIGEFRVESAVAPDRLTPENLAGHLCPLFAAVQHLPQCPCSADELAALRQGKAVRRDGWRPEPCTAAILDSQGELAALVEYDHLAGLLRPRLVRPLDQRRAEVCNNPAAHSASSPCNGGTGSRL